MAEAFSLATERLRDRFAGCLLGGAVGDALGAPVEFMTRAEILKQYGRGGIQEYAHTYGRVGAITDDTQMTLFTAEGLLRAWVRGNLRGICHAPSVIAHAYQRWLSTQDVSHPLHRNCIDGWLVAERRLHARRAPGSTCLEALRAMEHSGTRASNDSKGCGGVMRVAPIGLFYARLAQMRFDYSVGDPYSTQKAFDFGRDAAAITHGHATGQLASGVFAAVIMAIAMGASLSAAIEDALQAVRERPGHEETSQAIEHALNLAARHPNDPDALAQLGQGWVAEEALAIALYCALGAKSFRSGVELAVNHDGDSDSTGSMAGQLLGASEGTRGIPASWIHGLELRDVIARVADDMVEFADVDLEAENATEAAARFVERYPGV